MKNRDPFSLIVLLAIVQLIGFATAVPAAEPMQVELDLRDLTRRLVRAELVIPVEEASESRTLPIWYPKWVPGSHGPGGPIGLR